MKQTAVLKFYKDLERYGLIKDSQFILSIPLQLMSEIFEQAMQMEKEQIMAAHEMGYHNSDNFDCFQNDNHYYNEMYPRKINHIVDTSKIISSQTELSDIVDLKTQNNTLFYNTEISDEEIVKQGYLHTYANQLPDENAVSFIQGVEWYREQLKQRQ